MNSSKKQKPRHPWDETLVIAVMVVSALCILILLASYISASGQATKWVSQQANSESVLSMINSATVGEGNGKTTCNVICTKLMEVCVVAHQEEVLVDCGTRLVGNYDCLCANPARITMSEFLKNAPAKEVPRVNVSCSPFQRTSSCLQTEYCGKNYLCSPLKGEGEACQSRSECISGICTLPANRGPGKCGAPSSTLRR